MIKCEHFSIILSDYVCILRYEVVNYAFCWIILFDCMYFVGLYCWFVCVFFFPDLWEFNYAFCVYFDIYV